MTKYTFSLSPGAKKQTITFQRGEIDAPVELRIKLRRLLPRGGFLLTPTGPLVAREEIFSDPTALFVFIQKYIDPDVQYEGDMPLLESKPGVVY
jgi:hypothetical protein